jgi:hypothetical protein
VSDTLRVGAAAFDITPGAGLPMGGYGARRDVSQGIHDPLLVRTTVLTDGRRRLVLAVCDLVGVPADIVSAARELIEKEHGIPAEDVCIAATHTHSGPAGLRNADAPEFVAVTARKIAGSVRMALDRVQPVRLKYGESRVTTISQNRRQPDWPIEETAKVLLAAPDGGDPPAATLVNYACHATVLEYDNLLYSADFPGAAARFVERNLGGACVYVQGACGNINPAWMRHDFAEVERVGGVLGAAAVRTAHELRPLGEGQWGINLRWSEQTPKEQPPGGALLTDLRLDSARRVVDLERRVLPPLEVIEAEYAELGAKLAALAATDVESRRELRPRLNQLRLDRAAAQANPARPGDREAIELQAWRLSAECALIALPGEFFVEIARRIEAEAGVPHLIIAGYANGAIGYVPTAGAFPYGGYEVGRARFVPDAAEVVVREAASLVRGLY